MNRGGVSCPRLAIGHDGRPLPVFSGTAPKSNAVHIYSPSRLLLEEPTDEQIKENEDIRGAATQAMTKQIANSA